MDFAEVLEGFLRAMDKNKETDHIKVSFSVSPFRPTNPKARPKMGCDILGIGRWVSDIGSRSSGYGDNVMSAFVSALDEASVYAVQKADSACVVSKSLVAEFNKLDSEVNKQEESYE